MNKGKKIKEPVKQAVDHRRVYIFKILRQAKELINEVDKVNRMTEEEFEKYEKGIGINTYYRESEE